MSPTATRWLLAGPLTLVGVLGVTAVWVALGLGSGRMLGGLALVAAADAVLLLAMSGMRGGGVRATTALLATLATVALANWLIIAGRIGRLMGLTPWDSAPRLSAELAWVMARETNGPWDLLGLAAGVVLAVILGFGRRNG